MLNDRERQALVRIEQHLVTSDPDFARQFRTADRRSPGTTPRLLLVVGLAVLVLGTAVSAVPIAVFGVLISMVALVAAYQRNGLAGFSAA